MLKSVARRIASNPRAYRVIQTLAGRRVIEAALAKAIPDRSVLTLDIGSSSGGALTHLVPRRIAIDIDLPPLLLVEQLAIQGDAGAIPIRSRSVPMTTCVAVSHHLDDALLELAFAEIARVTQDVFVFVDAVRNDGRVLSRLLWRYDRGANPRTADELEAALARSFDIVTIERFAYLHQYWLAVATPRRTPR